MLDFESSFTEEFLELIDFTCWPDEGLDNKAANATVETLALNQDTYKRPDTEQSCACDGQRMNGEPPRKRRLRLGPTIPKRPREKQQIEALRAQITVLEAQLSQVHKLFGATCFNSQKIRRFDDVLWKDMAIKQLQERARAEKQNMKLKELVAEQAVFSRSFSTFPREWNACGDIAEK